jgi:Cyclic nucleotide-binding domain
MRPMDTVGFEKTLGMRPGEGRLVAGLAALFALLEGARGFGEVGADAQVLARFGPEALPTTLPYLFIALGAVSLVVALGYTVGLARLPRIPLFVGILVGIAALLVAQRVALAAGTTAIVPILWLTVFTSSAVGATLAWTVAGSTFDARQAKRLFPLLTGAAIAGSFVGTLASGPVARLTGVESLMLVQAALLGVAGLLLWRLPRPRPRASTTRGSVVEDLRIGFDTVRHSSLMRLVALAYVLLAVLLFSVSYPFLIAASAAFPDKVELATALGLLSTAITASSFVASLVVANRLYARFGVSAGALALPILYVAGFGLWIVAFSFPVAALVRYGQQVTQRGVSNAAWSAFYNVIPADRRAQVLAFNDGVPGQVGTVLSGVLLLATAGLVSLVPVFALGLMTAVIATIVVIGIRRRYADSLLTALRSGLAEQILEGETVTAGLGGAGLARPEVRAALVAALDVDDPGTRRIGVAYLRRIAPLAEAEQARLERLVDDPDPGVRAEVAVAIAGSSEDPRPTAVLGALLSSLDEDDQVAGLGAAARIPWLAPTTSIAALLGANSARVRAAAIAAAAAHPDAADVVPTRRLVQALDDEATIVRAAAAAALKARSGAGTDLVEVLRTGTPGAVDAALAAIAGHATTVRDDLLAWAHDEIERAESLHHAHAAVASMADGEERDFLAAVIDQRIRRAEDRAIATLVAIGAPTAGGLMRRSLRSSDPDARAQAIEALDSLGDRDLGRALTACLEAADERAGEPSLAMVQRLAQDDDRWIRTLSQRLLDAPAGDHMAEGQMAGADVVATEIDRMLLLRRIPLFAGLDPEDLERIAMATEERDWAEGEIVIEEGDVGDSVVVLTEGTVRVVHVGPGGEERFIREYEAGDHIGELAVLRERPRAATVIANAGGVRGLVLGGDGLRAILRERPDAAMAMLATLAERLTRSA